MAINGVQNSNLEYTAPVTETREVSAPNSIMTQVVGTEPEATTPQSPTNTKRTVDDLYKKLDFLRKLYKLNDNDLKNILEKVSGNSEDALLKADDSTIDYLVKVISNSLKVLKARNTVIDVTSIINMSKSLKIMDDNQWGLDEAVERLSNKNKSQESFAEKLKRVYSGVKELQDIDFENPTPAQIKIIEKYTKKYMEKYYTKDRIGFRDIAVMLANSKTDAERDIFDKILKDISPEYRDQFIASWLYSYEDDDNRNKAATGVLNNFFDLTSDMTPEGGANIMFNAKKAQNNTDDIENTDRAFYEANSQYYIENDVEKILNKVKEQGIDSLEADEREIYDEWNRRQEFIAGNVNGNIANQNVDREFKLKHIQNYINTKLNEYGDDSYNDIMSKIKEFFKDHGDEFDMDEDSFNEFMNEATEDGYSNAFQSDAGSGYSSVYQVNNFGQDVTAMAGTDIYNDENNADGKTESKKLKNLNFTNHEERNNKDFVRRFFQINGLYNGIKDIFSFGETGSQLYRTALVRFGILSDSQEINIVANGQYDGEVFGDIKNMLTPDQLAKASNEITGIYRRNQINEKCEEYRKRNLLHDDNPQQMGI